MLAEIANATHTKVQLFILVLLAATPSHNTLWAM